MKPTRQLAVATLIQFITMSLLSIANGLNSIISTCRNTHTDCISNLMITPVIFILTVAWFAAIWVIGYSAQDRRSKRLARILIVAEVLTLGAALINAKGHTDILSLFTSVTDMVLVLWVISLAVRLLLAKDKRLVSRSGRQRRRPTKK